MKPGHSSSMFGLFLSETHQPLFSPTNKRKNDFLSATEHLTVIKHSTPMTRSTSKEHPTTMKHQTAIEHWTAFEHSAHSLIFRLFTLLRNKLSYLFLSLSH